MAPISTVYTTMQVFFFMMFKAVLIALLLCVAGCGGDGTPELEKPYETMGDGPGASSDHGGAEKDITGTWRYEYSSTGCVEEFRFFNSGRFEYRSLDEIITGTYQIISESSVYMVSENDNGEADCAGISDFDIDSGRYHYYLISENGNSLYIDYYGGFRTYVRR